MISRRTPVAGAAAAVPMAWTGRVDGRDEPPPAIAAETVGRFVGRSHRDLDAVREMLRAEPALANACWDWGAGDFETGLGAAAHTGRREIAELILERGGRLDVFAATMLGMRPVVRSVLDAMPSIHAVPGPHGIPLLSHAVVGREHAFEIVELLLARGAAVNAASRIGMTPLMMAASTGQIDTVALLLERGADPTPKDSKGRRAIDVAREREHDAVVALLSK